MKHWDQLCEMAHDNYGLITYSEAKNVCVADVELSRWVKKGWLEKRGWGVYRIAGYPVEEKSRFAEAVALCGGGVVFGEGVLALHNLALVNPGKVTVAVMRKLRRTLPNWVEVKRMATVNEAMYFGIPAQRLDDAIRTCRATVPRDRLLSAIAAAEKEGLLFGPELLRLKEEMSK